MALTRQVSKLVHSEIEIMILTGSALLRARDPTDCHTHTHTCHVSPRFVQKWDHMPALGDGALDTGIEGITGEEGEDIGLAGKPRVGAVVVHEGLETGDAADGFCRSRSIQDLLE